MRHYNMYYLPKMLFDFLNEEQYMHLVLITFEFIIIRKGAHYK